MEESKILNRTGSNRKNIPKKKHAVIDSRRPSEPTTEGQYAHQ